MREINAGLRFKHYNKTVIRVIAGIIAGIMLCGCGTAYAEQDGGDTAVDISDAKAAIVAESSTGTVLYQYNAHQKLPIASVTKLMCLYIWGQELEAGRLSMEDIVTCPADASGVEGSVIWLEPGEEMSVADIIKSVVIASANDACKALCEHICGSEQEFVQRMNKTAQQLGMTDTSYENCIGYDSDRHYSTAYDTALLCAAISRYDYYNAYFSTRLDYVREGERATQLLNTNKLMQRYDGIIGGKTGTTDKAGCCLAVWAKRRDMQLCAVELGCSDTDRRFDICERLLDYGFNGFELYRPVADIGKLTPIPVENGLIKQTDIRIGRLITAVIPKGQSGNVKYEYKTAETLTAPFPCGYKAGSVTASLGGEIIFSGDIVTVSEAEKLTFWKSLILILQEIFSF